MPIRGDALKVKKSMQEQYGDEWESVFYATAKKQGRNPETWEKIDESINLRDAILGKIAQKVIAESMGIERVVVSSCEKLITEAVNTLTEEQQSHFRLLALILEEELVDHGKVQATAISDLMEEPGTQRWLKVKGIKEGPRAELAIFNHLQREGALEESRNIAKRHAMAYTGDHAEEQKNLDKSAYWVEDREPYVKEITDLFRQTILKDLEVTL